MLEGTAMFDNSAPRRRAVPVAVALLLTSSPLHAAGAALNEEGQTRGAGIGALAQIDPASGQSADLLGDYRLAVQRLVQAKVYNQNLAQVVADQQRAMSGIDRKIDNYERSKQDLVPLMLDMIETLDRFIELDLPFHLDERRERVAKLRAGMNDSGIGDAEKFRRLMEAYQIEMDFGRTIDAGTGWLETNGPRREVNFLRVGRVVLAYQTHDRAETGFFNPSSRQWQTLPDEYRAHVAAGLRIAKKQAAPNLVRLPVAAPEPAQ